MAANVKPKIIKGIGKKIADYQRDRQLEVKGKLRAVEINR